MFAFDLGRLRGRVPSWPAPEAEVIARLVDDLWQNLLARYPADVGNFSDGPTLIDLTYWCDQPVEVHLDRWQSISTVPAAQHLGELVDWVFTVGEPLEPAVTEPVLRWLRQPVIGERLRSAKLESAEELWRVCGRG